MSAQVAHTEPQAAPEPHGASTLTPQEAHIALACCDYVWKYATLDGFADLSGELNAGTAVDLLQAVREKLERIQNGAQS